MASLLTPIALRNLIPSRQQTALAAFESAAQENEQYAALLERGGAASEAAQVRSEIIRGYDRAARVYEALNNVSGLVAAMRKYFDAFRAAGLTPPIRQQPSPRLARALGHFIRAELMDAWLATPNSLLGRRTPAQVLASGEEDNVWAAMYLALGH
jgi:hypothetical protein